MGCPTSRRLCETWEWSQPKEPHPLQPADKSQFQRLDRERKVPSLRLTEQKMDMFRHNHISENSKPVSASDSFESRKKKITSKWVIKEWTPLVATERYEMKIASTIEAPWMIGHEARLWKGVQKCL